MATSKEVGGFVAFVLLLIVLRFVMLGLSVWALWFGIADLVAVGANVWAIIWTVVGGIGVLSFIFGGRSNN